EEVPGSMMRGVVSNVSPQADAGSGSDLAGELGMFAQTRMREAVCRKDNADPRLNDSLFTITQGDDTALVAAGHAQLTDGRGHFGEEGGPGGDCGLDECRIESLARYCDSFGERYVRAAPGATHVEIVERHATQRRRQNTQSDGIQDGQCLAVEARATYLGPRKA